MYEQRWESELKERRRSGKRPFRTYHRSAIQGIFRFSTFLYIRSFLRLCLTERLSRLSSQRFSIIQFYEWNNRIVQILYSKSDLHFD